MDELSAFYRPSWRDRGFESTRVQSCSQGGLRPRRHCRQSGQARARRVTEKKDLIRVRESKRRSRQRKIRELLPQERIPRERERELQLVDCVSGEVESWRELQVYVPQKKMWISRSGQRISG